MRKALELGAVFLVLALLLFGVVVAGLWLADPGEPDEEVVVAGGEIESDQTELWEWTQRAMGQEIHRIPAIRIRDLPDRDSRRNEQMGRFQRRFLATESSDGSAREIPALADRGRGYVLIDPDRIPERWNESTTAAFDRLLVHEFAHIVQYESLEWNRARQEMEETDDGRRAFAAITEGGAEFVASHHANESNLDRYREVWTDPDTTAAERYSLWPYYRGTQHVQARLEHPSVVLSLYEDPPETTAEIVRGEPPDEASPMHSVYVDLDNYSTAVRDDVGAAFVEVVLTEAVGPERARTVAAGWRWDTHLTFRDPSTETSPPSRHVWLTQWQSERAADAFEAATTEYLDARWDADGDTWSIDDEQSVRLARVDADSVALALGPERFLAEASVEPTDGGYDVVSANASATSAVRASGSSPSTAVAAASGPGGP